MLLTLTTTHRPATDLGYLLAKNPARVQSVSLPFGRARVFYPEASEARCTAALVLEFDLVGLVRGRRGPSGEGAHRDRAREAGQRGEASEAASPLLTAHEGIA